MSAFSELIICRVNRDQLLVPLAAVARVAPALEPVRALSTRPAPPRVTVDGAPVPVWFGAALLGASKVVLEPSDQMLVLRGERPVVLWVSAVEEVVQAQVHAAEREGPSLVAGWCEVAGRSLPVLDVAAFLISISEVGGHEHAEP